MFIYIKNTDSWSLGADKKSVAVTKSTAMGILNRLVGEIRKVKDIENDDNYFFKNIEPLVQEPRYNIHNTNTELIMGASVQAGDAKATVNSLTSLNHPYIKGRSGTQTQILLDLLSRDARYIMNLIKDIYSAYEKDRDAGVKEILAQFFKDNIDINKENDLHSLCEKINDSLSSYIYIDDWGERKQKKYSEEEARIKAENKGYVVNDESIKMIRELVEVFVKDEKDRNVFLGLFGDEINYKCFKIASMQLLTVISTELEVSNISGLNSKKGIAGISKKDFSEKGFLASGLSGHQAKRKAVNGSPIGKDVKAISGELIVEIKFKNIDDAKNLKMVIEQAAVGSFRLGKKGLAYVDAIYI